MSSIAYKDYSRTQIAYAASCTIKDKNTRYYCENPACDAHLYIRAVDSVLVTHFYTTKEHPHTGWCRNEHPDFKPTNYNENDFDYDYDNAMNEILSAQIQSLKSNISRRHTIGNGKIRSLSKTAQIYTMCKHYRPENTYHGIEIWRMLFDVRCNHLLSKGLFGIHLIECVFHKYSKNEQCIYFYYPLNKSLPNQYKLRIHIHDKDLFYKLNKKLYNKDNRPIVIAGHWEKYATDSFQSEVISGKQIYLP